MAPVLVPLFCFELQTEPSVSPPRGRRSYLLVILHIVAQTDQTGLELLGHQGPAVVLRSAREPNDGAAPREDESERRGWRMGGDVDGMQRQWVVEDGGTDTHTSQDV